MFFKPLAPLLALGALTAASPLQLQISMNEEQISTGPSTQVRKLSSIPPEVYFNLVALDPKTYKPIRNDYQEDFFLGIHPARIFPPLVSLVTPAFAKYEHFTVAHKELKIRDFKFSVDRSGLIGTHIIGEELKVRWEVVKGKAGIDVLLPIIEGKELPPDSFRAENFHLGSRVYVCAPGKADAACGDNFYPIVFRAVIHNREEL